MDLHSYPFGARLTRCTLQLFADLREHADRFAALAAPEVERIEEKYSRYPNRYRGRQGEHGFRPYRAIS